MQKKYKLFTWANFWILVKAIIPMTGVSLPALIVKAMEARDIALNMSKVADQVMHLFNDDSKSNQDFYREALERGDKELAKLISEKLYIYTGGSGTLTQKELDSRRAKNNVDL